MVLRARADECPGVFAQHDAADGAVARVRLPGGRITARGLRVIAGCAEDLGDGAVHLTSRGNVQLRGLDRDDGSLVTRLSAAGLLPSPAHERVRNFLASPLSGLAGGLADVGPLVSELDAAVCAQPTAARLPGRFLFALDDGRGDTAAEDPDVCWRAVSSASGALLLAGRDTGLRIPVTEAVAALIAVALRFVEVRGTAWRVRELTDPEVLLDGLADGRWGQAESAEPEPEQAKEREQEQAKEPEREQAREPEQESVTPCPLGEFEFDEGGTGLVVAPVLGECTAGQLRTIADLLTAAQADPAQAATAQAVAVITPWRSIVLPRNGDLAGSGLLTDPAAPAAGVSACIGRPGCAKSRADVRSNARSLISMLPSGVRVHYSGCPRRCGRPHGPHLDVVARAAAGDAGASDAGAGNVVSRKEEF
jgi:precorrin-3B synthase